MSYAKKHKRNKKYKNSGPRPYVVRLDNAVAMAFPPTIDEFRLVAGKGGRKPGADHFLRYESEDPPRGKAHFDIAVCGSAPLFVPAGFSREHLAEMAKAVAAVGEDPRAEDVRFGDDLFCGMLERTTIPFLVHRGSYREVGCDALFGTTVVVLPFRGKYFEIRYSEPWVEKGSKSADDILAIFMGGLARPHKSMESRVEGFLRALDGLLLDVLKSIQPDMVSWYRLGVDPSVSDDEAFAAIDRKLEWLSPPDIQNTVRESAMETVAAYLEIWSARRIGRNLDDVIPLFVDFLDRFKGRAPAALRVSTTP